MVENSKNKIFRAGHVLCHLVSGYIRPPMKNNIYANVSTQNFTSDSTPFGRLENFYIPKNRKRKQSFFRF
jgi:hypothetical protein